MFASCGAFQYLPKCLENVFDSKMLGNFVINAQIVNYTETWSVVAPNTKALKTIENHAFNKTYIEGIYFKCYLEFNS